VAEEREVEIVAQEMSRLTQEVSRLAEETQALERVSEVEIVNERLEVAAVTTARALHEVSTHWDRVYEAMRRADKDEAEIES
jgi:hypothetical protein